MEKQDEVSTSLRQVMPQAQTLEYLAQASKLPTTDFIPLFPLLLLTTPTFQPHAYHQRSMLPEQRPSVETSK